MGTVRLLVLRARARVGLLLSLGAIVAVSAYFLGAIGGGLAATTADGVASTLSSSGSSTELLIAATPPQPDDVPQAVAAIDGIIAAVVPDGDVSRATAESGDLIWTITPAATALTPAGAQRLGSEVGELLAVIATNPVENTRIAATGGLPSTLADLDRGILAIASITPVPVLVILVFAAIALTQIARLLAAARLGETELALARGMTRVQLAGLAAVEGGVVAAVGVLIGLGLAVVTLLLVHGAHPAIASGWPVALLAASLAPIALAIDAWSRSRGSAARAESSGRGVGTAATGAVLAGIAAGVAVTQLLQYGSPLVLAAAGGVRIDVVAEAAPVLVLLAGALIALLAFRPISAVVQRLAARRASLPGVLAARQVARRIAMFQVPLLLVSLAIATATFAAGYEATWSSLASASAEQETGASVRARLADDAAPTAVIDRVRGVDGVADAAPAVAAPIHVGSDSGSITALPAERIPSVMRDVGGTVDTAGIRTAVDSPAPGAPLPSNASVLSTTLAISAPDTDRRGLVTVSAWLADADGSLVSIALGQVPVGTDVPVTLTAELPVGTRPWHLLAVDGELGAADGADGIVMTVTAWGTEEDGSAAIPVPSESSANMSSTEPVGRVMATETDDAAVAAVITEALAARLGVGIGDRFDYQFDGVARSGSVVVRGTTPSIPGSAESLGMIVSLPALNDALLRTNDSAKPPNEIWMATPPGADLAAVADRVGDELGRSATVTAAVPGIATALAAPGVIAVWAGVAAAIALAAVAMVAITIALLAARAAEAALLRAVGVTARAQAAGRAVELAVVSTAGVLLGLVIGVVTVLLTCLPFARGAVANGARGIDLPPSVDVVRLAIATVVVVVALGVIIAAYAARVRRQAADALLGGAS